MESFFSILRTEDPSPSNLRHSLINQFLESDTPNEHKSAHNSNEVAVFYIIGDNGEDSKRLYKE